jgi:hypothetical protein
MFLLNGQPLPIDTPFIVNGVEYPANWLRLTTQAEHAAIGITEIADQPRPDDQYYWVTQNADGSYTSTAKDLPTLKSTAVKQVQQTVWQMLHPTDYMDSRKTNDSSYTPPAAWITWRAAMRTEMTTAIAAINAATDIPSLITAKTITWPNDPDYVAPTTGA